MPTPRETDDPSQLVIDLHLDRSAHTLCPVENERSGGPRGSTVSLTNQDNSIDDEAPPRQQDSPQSDDDMLGLSPDSINHHSMKTNATIKDRDSTPSEALSPMSAMAEPREIDLQESAVSTALSLGGSSSINYGIDNTRMIMTHNSSFLRAGSKFQGTQQSDKQKYNVEVDIKSVNMAESELCGYLRIEGLTPEHATLTTYFEGEIIGPKYTFQTRHESWGATDKTDMQHWARFPAWRPLAKLAKKPDFHYKNSAQRENLFMRWKESFLVPDHRVREISGASFEGFYYICFNQVTGNISGIYFHARSEKYQQLELSHVHDKGCYGAFEFR